LFIVLFCFVFGWGLIAFAEDITKVGELILQQNLLLFFSRAGKGGQAKIARCPIFQGFYAWGNYL
jgi:hypothetical protein